ncbi:hypothetical protein OROGR_031826 [Orobanche gracilis]
MAQVTESFENPRAPKWLKLFKSWFPRFLQCMSKHSSYALSSLKPDFRTKFGFELDHSSVGYSKLNDFLKSLSNSCAVKILPITKRGTSTHMILLPKYPSLDKSTKFRNYETLSSDIDDKFPEVFPGSEVYATLCGSATRAEDMLTFVKNELKESIKSQIDQNNPGPHIPTVKDIVKVAHAFFQGSSKEKGKTLMRRNIKRQPCIYAVGTPMRRYTHFSTNN